MTEPVGDTMTKHEELLTMIKDAGSECITWPYASDSHGYGQCRVDGRTQQAHRVALMAVSTPPTRKHHASHGPCHNPKCINPRHLSWKTAKENLNDRLRDGTLNSGMRNGRSVLTEGQVHQIREDTAAGELQKTLSERYGVSQSTISLIASGRRWGQL